jgi:hypothetical protein
MVGVSDRRESGQSPEDQRSDRALIPLEERHDIVAGAAKRERAKRYGSFADSGDTA